MDANSGTAQDQSGADRSRLRRFLEVTAFWGVWIALGEALDLGPSRGEVDTYLLLGAPLVVLFQLFVARRGIRELWVRTAPKLVFSRLTIALAIAIGIYPIIALINAIADSEPASIVIGLALIATVGAVAAAYAYGLFRSETWRYLGLCILFVTGYMVGSSLVFDGETVFTHPLEAHPDRDLDVFLLALLQYIPTVFVFEEVAFRGALDSHLHHPGERHGFWTASYISFLWCMWHAPLFGWGEFPSLIVGMFPMGIALSIYWRRSGNLGVSGGAHALSDSIRNALWGVP
jgi:membrane protease YdiL (CAAX protease family)